MLFERFEKGGDSGGVRGGRPTRGGGGGSPARPGGAQRAEAVRRAVAPASQQGAIDNMKLAQQLRRAEQELDKVGRLHLIKSRRVMELELQLDAQYSGFEAKKHELERITAERDATIRERDAGAKQVEQLQAQGAELQATLVARDDEIEQLRLEIMKLTNRIDTLQHTQPGGAAPAHAPAPRAHAPEPSWRPPKHPDLPSFDVLWSQIAAAGGGGGESATGRSDTTLSVGEWPEELRL